MFHSHDPTWYPARHRHMRQAALHAYARAMNPISAIRSRVCRYIDGCFEFSGKPDEQGRCMKIGQHPPYYFHYRGQNVHRAMECTIDPACRVVFMTGPGWSGMDTAPCPPGMRPGYGRYLLPPTEEGNWKSYKVCCPQAPSQRVAVSTPRWP
jgi:hypothetical protein